MTDRRFLRNVFFKGVGLFLVFNLLWGLIPHEGIGGISLYNILFRGRERFPFGENPAEAYNLSLYNLDAMFASHKLTAAPKPADEYRIFLIGDSATWGTLLKPEETLAGLLDGAGVKTAAGKQVRVYNLGYPTLSLMKDLIVLDQAMQYQPDLILWPFTLEAFPRDRQLDSPIVANNLDRVQTLVELYDLNLEVPAERSGFFSRTLAGERRALADLIRLQLYGVMWSATGIDQAYPEDFQPAARDLVADDTFNGWQDAFPQEALAYEVLTAGIERAGDVPVVLINEPMLISQGENSDLRYNFYYPRWAYDSYLVEMQTQARLNGWTYLDLHDIISGERFTNSAIHLDPQGEQQLTTVLIEHLRSIFSDN
jgi:hypothetical protein